MSFFYLSPVRGDMPVHILEENVLNRLQYLQDILKNELVPYNEFVVEGSVYDNVGHYMLCVAVILLDNIEFRQFLLKSEVELFKRRLASLSSYDLRCFAKKMVRNIQKYVNVPTYVEPLQILCQHLMLKDMAQHVSCSIHNIECTSHCIQLNFRHCLHFIAKRQVEITNGIVSLPCGRWKQYLTLIFAMNLKYKLNNKNLTQLKSDPRINELLCKIGKKVLGLRTKKDEINELKSSEVDAAMAYFPPCMVNLHRQLRSRHRLSHYERFYYSLFLKDIGMSIEEAIQFWSMEYRQNPNGNHSCCHHWKKDEKKYLYGIRHMYGLEGGKKSYTSVSCHRIQGMDVSCFEGGCPFKSFDLNNMAKTLNIRAEEQLFSQINDLCSRHQYTSACILFLQKKHDIVCENDNNMSFNFTPVKFYMKSTKKVM